MPVSVSSASARMFSSMESRSRSRAVSKNATRPPSAPVAVLHPPHGTSLTRSAVGISVKMNRDDKRCQGRWQAGSVYSLNYFPWHKRALMGTGVQTGTAALPKNPTRLLPLTSSARYATYCWSAGDNCRPVLEQRGWARQSMEVALPLFRPPNRTRLSPTEGVRHEDHHGNVS